MLDMGMVITFKEAYSLEVNVLAEFSALKRPLSFLISEKKLGKKW
jgi:hypothetical protein